MNNRLVRVIRGRRLDRNPLRRRTDRVQTITWAALFVMFAAVAPFAYNASVTRAADMAAHNRAVTLAVGREVTAVTTMTAPEPADTLYIGVPQALVTARWTAPDGHQRTGSVEVPRGTPAHSKVTVWVRQDGTLIPPPVSATGTRYIAVGTGIGVLAALFLVCSITGMIVVLTLNRRRMAAWDAEWDVTEPAWTHRR